MKKYYGFTFIELIIFIVVTAIIASSILLAATTALKYSYFPQSEIIAAETASKCAEWFIGQRNINGFSCTAGNTVPTFCTAPTGYIISANVTCPTSFEVITINVTGRGNAKLQLELADY